MKLLCISNGHGEDAIALPVLQELRKLAKSSEIVALPIVGVGNAYRSHDFPIAGKVQIMPSGGFLNQDNRQLARDLQGGLVGLTIDQIRTIRNWGKSGGQILAVGDIVPLLFAWLSGAQYAFIGTAKSEYYLRDRQGQILPSQRNSIEAKTGSVYFPWERWLLSRRNCQAVFARDKLTAEVLQQWQIPAFDLGNPMTDGVAVDVHESVFDRQLTAALVVTLLPGSRPPEAYANWNQIVIAVESLISAFPDRKILCLAAIVPTLDLNVIEGNLSELGWLKLVEIETDLANFIPEDPATYYRRQNVTIAISTKSGRKFMQLGECAIAMAGTATEQFISLGRPAAIVPGAGPQFTPAFAEAQTRLLGESVILVPQPQDVGVEIQQLLQQPDRLRSIAQNGLLRMGTSGAARRIAECLMEVMS
jgi:uncharacterized protein (TIGR03492 family)